MPEETRDVADQDRTETPEDWASGDPAKIITIANAAFIGVPTAYATSRSWTVAVTAAGAAVALAVVYLILRWRLVGVGRKRS